VTVHRARGFGRYLALRRATPRHHVDDQLESDRRPLLILFAIVAAVVAGTLVMTARWSPGVTPRSAATSPTVSIPATATGTPSFRSGLSAARGAPSAGRPSAGPPAPTPSPKPSSPKPSGPQPAAAEPTAVLLGPEGAVALAAILTDYCGARAVVVEGDWTCKGKPIDMDKACVFRYDEDAWAGMLNDDDPRTWRCYRDVS
jgi:hypothetical protein